MKRILLLLFVILIPSISFAKPNDDELSPAKMQTVVKAVCNGFIAGDGPKLKKYISQEWLSDKNIDITKYYINTYSPQKFDILFTTSNVVVVAISGESWTHMLMFKFVDEDGKYRLIPKGVSSVSSDYIDPWWDLREYFKTPQEEEIEE